MLTRITSIVVALAVALSAAVATPAAAAPPSSDPHESARQAAIATHRRVEVGALTTETGQVFANPNGTFTMVQSVIPVRVRRSSGWTAVDTN